MTEINTFEKEELEWLEMEAFSGQESMTADDYADINPHQDK